MAKPLPQKNMTFIWVLWTISLVMLFYMMNNKPKDTKSLPQVYEQLKQENVQTKDLSIKNTLHSYESMLDAEQKVGSLSADEVQKRKIEAAILVANTQLRAGLMRHETGRIRFAYQTLWAHQKREIDTPLWKDTTFTTAPDSRFPEVPSSTTGQALFDKTRQILSDRNKKEVVWGFIPGGYQFIDGLIAVTGRNPYFSYWFGALLLAFVVRAIVFPFSQKTIMHARKMSQLAPFMAEIKEQFKDEPQQMQLKTMELYKEYGLNPMAGCMPALVQMPLFFTVYQFMLLYEFDFQKGLFLWINPTMSKATHGFIAPNLGTQDTLLIILYGVSMIVTQLLTPISDPSQKKQMRLMGVGISVLFTVFMFTGAFPVVGGFVLYWTFTNILATAQSLRAYRLPLSPLQKVNTKDGGVYPQDPSQLFPWMKNQSNGNASKNGAADLKTSTKTGKPQQHKPKK